MSSPTPSVGDRLRGLLRRLYALVRGRETERAMSDELAFHVDMETEKNIRAGLDPVAAREAALRDFGGVGRISEDVRAVRKIEWVDDLARDLRHAARGFRRAPGFTAAAIAALSLGIGANTAVFAVVHAVVIAPLPYAEPDRLLRLWEGNPAQGIVHGDVSPGTFVDLRARSRSLERIAVYTERDFLLTEAGETWESRAAAVSPVLFDMLGAQPMLGRAFPAEGTPSERAASSGEVVISHALWQRRFGSDPNVAGRTIRMDYRWTYTIVGVMPAGFSFPVGTDLWTTLTYETVSAGERQLRYHGAIAQLRPGYTIEQAMTESRAIAAQIATEHPASNAGWTIELMRLDRSIVGDTRPTLLILLGLAGCVLLVACGNVATLAVARATARRHETAVRVALGAGMGRLLRQWTAEGLLLALFGGIGGLIVGYWSNRLLLAVAPADIPRIAEVSFAGGPVLIFALVLTAAAAGIIGVAPVLRLRESRPLDAMRSWTSGAGAVRVRSREWLVGSQVALTMVLTVSAALLLRSFERLQSTDLGFRRHDILSAEVRTPIGRFAQRPWYPRVQFYNALIEDLATIPGVRAVAGTTRIPLTGDPRSGSMWRTDAPGAEGRRPPTSAADQWKAGIQLITPTYFETMGIPLMRGRPFATSDRFTQQEMTDPDVPRPPGVAIINDAMARKFWPDADPIGQTIFLFDDQTFAAYRTIVGVVRDTRAESVAASASPTVFLPFAQNSGNNLSLVLRTDLPPIQLVGAVTDRLRAFDPAISISAVRPFDAVVGSVLSRPRFTMLLVGSFAALALIIAGVGVFGIVGFLVTRRTHEIGIRIALGARPRSVLWLVLSEGLQPVIIGALVGCIGAVAVAQAMRALLYGLAPLDVTSFAVAALLLLGASVLAAVVPARRAAGLDPLRALRIE